MPSFFQDAQSGVDLYPVEKAGFRAPQLGASAALIAHGTRFVSPAAVTVLPTGTGKTAVLQLLPFLWAAKRVLVITPARLVREQIANGFSSLSLLKQLGILDSDLEPPSVHIIKNRIKSIDDWQKLRALDVVVTTPMSASPSIADVTTPPGNLFDLVLVDEAHHTPATSYTELIDAFPDARKAFFTATPFRRDRKRLPGKIVFKYPLRDAIADGTYGKVEYVACTPADGEPADVAIAKAAEMEFVADRDQGLDHRLMVRTDSLTRAKELVKLYADETTLRLRPIYGSHSLGHVNSVIKKLDSGS